VSGAGLASRPPAVAGSFYDAHPQRLAATVDTFLADACPPPAGSARPTALVVPHAGHVYSGPVAASAYATLRPHTDDIRRVVLIGPSHFVPLRGMAVPAAAAFATPLGDVPVDVAGCVRLAGAVEGVQVSDRPHRQEHSLEVQLPFLQRLLPGGVALLPVLVGGAAAEDVAAALDATVAAGDLVVVSTDLSHHLDADTARRRDRATAEAVVRRDPGAIGARDACGAVPLRGLLVWARRHDLSVRLLDLRTSADTAGGRRQVVGYGAFRLG
jgi:AmmeMemoRadiSam system protein B